MLAKLKQHKIVIWLLALIGACGVAIAVSELAGQANKTTANAGLAGADTEIASLDTIKPSESNPIDWTKERNLRKNIDAINENYMSLASKASAEIETSGQVSVSTRDAGLACAQDFKAANETYAQFWESNNGPTRARLAREAGEARVKNADMTFNEIDSDKISAYNDQMNKLAEARSAYLEEAKTDVSAKDRADIRSSLMPRLSVIGSNLKALISTIQNMISELRSQLGGGIGGLTSCASDALTSDNPNAALLSPLTNLLSLVQSLASNVNNLADDLAALE